MMDNDFKVFIERKNGDHYKMEIKGTYPQYLAAIATSIIAFSKDVGKSAIKITSDLSESVALALSMEEEEYEH